MKVRILFTYLIIFLLFTNCKKDDGIDPQSEAELFEVFQVLEQANSKFLENLDKNTGNPWLSIAETGEWVKTLPNVKEVIYEDSVNIFIDMESGRRTSISFNELDAQGESKYRGGGNGNDFRDVTDAAGSCTNVIDNKKVLIYAASYSDLYRDDPEKLQRVVDVFENAEADFEVTVLKDAQCKPEIIETFGQYGLVIIETHGSPREFVTGTEIEWDSFPKIKTADELKNYVDAQFGPQYFRMMEVNKILLQSNIEGNPTDPNWWLLGSTLHSKSFTLSVSTDYIASLPPTPNTMYVGNMCYSGVIEGGFCNRIRPVTPSFEGIPMRAAFLKLNPISYYCYNYTNGISDEVLNSEAKRMIYELAKSLIDDGDSTGAAHLDNDGNLYEIALNFKDPRCADLGFNFRQYGKVDYCYGGCGDSIVDARDGQKYATVCIGEQTWMAENLNWAGAGVCYDNLEANCNVSGRLYSIDEATGRDTSQAKPSGVQGVCPNGWHVPSMAEWHQLVVLAGGELIAGKKLKSTTGWPNASGNTDEFGFNLKPSGELSILQGVAAYNYIDFLTNVWSTNGDQYGRFGAITIYDTENSLGNSWGYADQEHSYYHACRCVKD